MISTTYTIVHITSSSNTHVHLEFQLLEIEGSLEAPHEASVPGKNTVLDEARLELASPARLYFSLLSTTCGDVFQKPSPT